MSTMPEAEVFVTLGIDTHKHTHVAVALDQLGRRLDELEIPATTAGFAELYAWASELGTIDTVGIEGHRRVRRRAVPLAAQIVVWSWSRSSGPTASCAATPASPIRSTPKPQPARSSPAKRRSPRSREPATSR
jgi:hypothetical protein